VDISSNWRFVVQIEMICCLNSRFGVSICPDAKSRDGIGKKRIESGHQHWKPKDGL
jgi:hypothetical protein